MQTDEINYLSITNMDGVNYQINEYKNGLVFKNEDQLIFFNFETKTFNSILS